MILYTIMDVLSETNPSTILMYLLIFGTCFLTCDLISPHIRSFLKRPPGPWSSIWISPLTNCSKPQHEVLSDLTRSYGPIISVRKGSDLIVAMRDPKLIRAAFKKEELTGRPVSHISDVLGEFGIINAQGQLWREERRFLHSGLRLLGMKNVADGKLDASISLEVLAFLDELKQSLNPNVDISSILSTSVGNVICSMIMNKRFDFGDVSFQRYLGLVDEGFALAGKLITEMKSAKNQSQRAKETIELLKQNREEINKFFTQIIQEHEESFDCDNIRDIIDFYVLERRRAKEEGRQLYHGKDESTQLHQVMGDLFTAGMETVKTTILWSVIFMLHHPNIQKRVQEELDEVVGPTRLPTSRDLPSLPYTEATILEVLRHSSIVPLGTTHATTDDIEIEGYIIPKNSHVIPLLHAVHHDADLWEEPDKFEPTRFLNDQGKVVKPDYFMPFGVGRRMCLGDILARKEIFQFFASILHTCSIELPKGHSLPSLQGNAGITLSPHPFEISLSERKPELVCDASSKMALNRHWGQ